MTAPALAFCFCLAPWLTASQIAAPEAASRTHRYSVTGASAWVAARDQGFSALPRRCATAVDQASQSLVIGRSGSAANPDVRPLLQLFTLTLSGPPNADWRQAFRR